MKLTKVGALAVAATLAFGAVGACATTPGATQGGDGADKGEIEVWSSLPRQGSSKGQTDTIVNGIRLALEERGETIEGWTIKYEDKDDSTAEAGQWTQDKEIENATGAANDENVVAYIGPFNSGAAQVSIPILCNAGLVQVSPANTYPGLTKPGKGAEGEPEKFYTNCKEGKKTYFRVIPADDLQGLAAAKWASSLGFKTVYVIDDSQLYGKGIADVFEREAPGQNLEVVGRTGILGTETDYKSLAEQIRGIGPDLVYFGGITQQNAGQLWRDVKEALPDVAMMGPDGILEEAFVTAAADAAEGTYITFGGLPADQLTGTGAEFVKAYEEKFGTLEAYTAYGYEAANVVLDAIERAAKRNPANKAEFRTFVLEEVAATKDYSGALGTWSFDENGDTTLTAMSGNVVEGGKFVFKEVIE
ncbi:MAG TPA: branched-chain amino acid ABC transporter substrate-binding protein [Vitreimonas sp.]|nr:branched-chain amino acid ABC transporter substrate-binding protein [Vitreimonas sp.]